MDKTAIQEIRSLAISALALPETEIPAITLPIDTKVQSLEKFQEKPCRFRAEFSTNIIGDMISYCTHHKHETSTIYIDTDSMQAQAIFDHGDYETPLWGDSTATLKLHRTPAYKTLLTFNEQNHSQQDLIDFLNDWKHHIYFMDENDEFMDHTKAINLIRRLKVSSTQEANSDQGNFSSSRSAMEQIEVTAAGESLPSYFIFTAAPYEQFTDREFKCDLRAITDKKEMALKYRIQGLQTTIENISYEFGNMLNEGIQDICLYLGTIKHQ